jgi:hypothetical protein
MRTPFHFSELAPGELTLDNRDGAPSTWELRQEDELVGVIESSPRVAQVSGRSGSWAVRSHRQRRGLVFTPSDVDGAMASYYPRRLLPGGTLALSEERWFELRPPGLFGKAWKLSDAEGRKFTRIPFSPNWPARGWLLRLDEGAAGEPEALLIVLSTCYVIVADRAQRPLSTG